LHPLCMYVCIYVMVLRKCFRRGMFCISHGRKENLRNVFPVNLTWSYMNREACPCYKTLQLCLWFSTDFHDYTRMFESATSCRCELDYIRTWKQFCLYIVKRMCCWLFPKRIENLSMEKENSLQTSLS
jgi:hypothetical protein